ncbi:MAG: N-6 DNA methylase, partial [Rhodoferax sp.]|nr:N-6 DNA methylase [Rhodoferax sp.]
MPFDTSGQITTRLVKLGASVLAVGPGHRNTTIAALVLALEDGDALTKVRFGGMDGAHGIGDTVISHCICAGPMNYKVPKSMDWRRWQDTFTKYRDLRVSADEMDRSDAWAVAAFWPQIRDRAVFACIPGLLFSQGQELRLRKALVHPKNQISSAMSLPQNMLSGTALAPVLLTLDAYTEDSVRMIDLSGPMSGGHAIPRFGKDLSVEDVMRLYENGNEKPYLSCNASIQDIE